MGGLLVSKFFDCDTPVMSNIKPLVKIPYTLSPLVESLGLIEQCCIIQPVQQCDIKEMADWPVASCWSLNLGWRSTCDWTHSCYTQGSQIRILEATSNMILYKGCCTRLPAGKNRFPSATSAHLESRFKFRSLWAPIPFHISARKSSLIAKFTEGVNRSPFPMATPIPFQTPLSCPWDTSKPLILVASQLAKCCFCAEGWFLCGMSGGREMVVSGDAYTLIPSSDAVQSSVMCLWPVWKATSVSWFLPLPSRLVPRVWVSCWRRCIYDCLPTLLQCVLVAPRIHKETTVHEDLVQESTSSTHK